MKRISQVALIAAAFVMAGTGALADPASPSPAAPPASSLVPPAPADATASAPPITTSPVGSTVPVNEVHLPADTVVRIETAEALSSRDRKRGAEFEIRLATPIIVDGVIVAPAGAKGMGEVVYGEAGSGGGAPGKLVLAARYINIGGVRIKLKAFNLASSGDSDFREMQVASEFIGVFVLAINGHDVEYPAGTRAHAKVAEDVILPALGVPPVSNSNQPQMPPASTDLTPVATTATSTSPPAPEPSK